MSRDRADTTEMLRSMRLEVQELAKSSAFLAEEGVIDNSVYL